MADKYIKRSDVQDALHSAIIEWNKDCGIARMEYLRIRLNNIPAADVEEVVRCEECEYAILAPSRKTATCMKSTLRNTHGYDWFCADGKRFEVQDDD